MNLPPRPTTTTASRGWSALIGALLLVLGALCYAQPAGAQQQDTTASAADTAAADTAADAETTNTADIPDLGVADAVILGLVEGITEFLPVSSTGHLLVTGRLLGLDDTEAAKDAFDSYAIAIQAGAIIAVLGLYWKRCLSVLNGVLGRDDDGRRLAINLIVAFIPAAVIGLALEGPIKDRLFQPWAIGVAWLVGGVGILLTEQRRRGAQFHGKTLDDLTVRMALIVGCCQAFAMWPGTSRSLVTILAGLAIGLQVTAAVELSFLLGLLTLGAATGYESLKNGSVMVDAYGVGRPLIGLVAALMSAFLAVKWMVNWLQSRGLGVFGWYRIGAAAVLFALLAAGGI